jgi:hypothetical protein
LLKQAEEIEKFKGSAFNDIVASKSARMDNRKKLLVDQAFDPASSKAMYQQAQRAPGGPEALRQSVGDAMGEGVVLKDPETGLHTVDYHRFLKNKQAAEEAGWWDEIFTPRDRTRFNAFEAYLRRTFKSEKDSGSNLQLGSQSGQMTKDPTRIWDVFLDMTTQKTLWWWLASDKMGDKVFNNLLKGRSAASMKLGKVLGMAMGGMVHEAQEETSANLPPLSVP